MNKKELRAAMARYGDTAKTLAQVIGTTPQSFSDKINGKSDFRQREMKVIATRYSLDGDAIKRIFFTHEVPCKGNGEECEGTKEVTT